MIENILEWIRRAIFKFLKIEDEPLMLNESIVEVDEKELERDRFMELYGEAKQNQEILNELSEEDLYKVMVLLNEEISIVANMVNEKVQKVQEKINVYYNKKELA